MEIFFKKEFNPHYNIKKQTSARRILVKYKIKMKKCKKIINVWQRLIYIHKKFKYKTVRINTPTQRNGQRNMNTQVTTGL